VGKQGYKTFGYFAGRVGTIERNDFVTPYKIRFPDGSSVAARLVDIQLVQTETTN
jgi:hypothetical protein